MLTKFGEYMRILRIKKGLLLKDSAESLGVSSAFLSSVENGKKKIPDEWFHKISSIYDLNIEEREELNNSIKLSQNQIQFDLSDCNEEKKDLLFQFQRSFSHLDEQTTSKIIDLLKGGKK